MRFRRVVAAAVSVAALLAPAGCSQHVHSHDEDERHELPAHTVTRWSDRTEVYAEFPALVAGRLSHFAVHLTELRTFEPLAGSRTTLEFEAPNGSTTVLRAGAPSRPGLYALDGAVPAAGRYRWRLIVDGPDLQDRHELGDIVVHRDVESARAASAREARGAGVSYLKEQQWQHGFATAVAGAHELSVVIRAPAVIRAAAGAEALVTAPADGRFVGRLPLLGGTIAEGQPLGQLEPRLAELADLTTLEADVAAKRAAAVEARTELARADLLLAARAVPARAVDRARHELDVARAELRAAEARLEHRQQTLAQGGSAAGRNAFVLRAPIAGTLVEISATPGAVYEAGATLFRIVRPSPVVVEVQVPESDAPRVGSFAGASIETSGASEPRPLTVRQVRHPGVIDPVTRALPVWLEVANADRRLLVGQTATALIRTGERRRMLSVPASAILTESGRPAVFVQVAGETFERRVVQLGARDGDLVAVTSGLQPGDRVVTRGAYDILLASALPNRPASGHVH